MPFPILLAVLLALVPFPQARAQDQADPRPVSVASIKPAELAEYEKSPEKIQGLIRLALSLAARKLDYHYGSADPKKGGMDCSGSVQWALKQAGYEELPRTSIQFYRWSEESLRKVADVHSAENPALKELKPGDLLFWTGTTEATPDHDPAISHVMIYLGTLKADGKGVVFGASDGRSFRGQRIKGVSVFDFKLPTKESKARFVAYGPAPGP